MKNEDLSRSLPHALKDSRGGGTPSYEGAIVGIEENRLVGWCWDPERPYEPVEIELFSGTQLIGRALADRFDPELAMNRKGNGIHRFEVSLQTLPEGDGPFVIQLYACSSAESLGVPFVFEKRVDLEALVEVQPVIGLLEGIRDGSACGWIAGSNGSDEAIGLRIEFDGQELVHADGLRRDTRVIHDGRMISAWRFAVPLPVWAIDGKLHEIAAFAHDVQLPGSPTSFGPTDVRGALRSVPAIMRDLQALRERVALLPDVRSTDALVDILSEQVLERVDMLLSVYRDGVEAELDVLRSEVTRLTGKDLSQAPVIATPRARVTPPSPLSPFSIDLASEPHRIVQGYVEKRHTAVLIHERVALNLPASLQPWQTLVIEGSGASSALNLLGWRFEQNGKQIGGRYQIFEGGNWIFHGRMLVPAEEKKSWNTARDALLIVSPTSAFIDTEGGVEKLEISRISVADALVVDTTESKRPIGLAIHLGAQTGGVGWHEPAESEDTWYRWAAATARLSVPLAPGLEMCRLHVVGEDSQPETLENLRISFNNHTIRFKSVSTGREFQRWTAEGLVPGILFESDKAWLEFSVPQRLARRPLEGYAAGDRRILTVSLRALALDRILEPTSDTAAAEDHASTTPLNDIEHKTDA